MSGACFAADFFLLRKAHRGSVGSFARRYFRLGVRGCKRVRFENKEAHKIFR